MFETTTREEVLRVRREGLRWLSTGWSGGFSDASAAYCVFVPEGWDCEDLHAYVAGRRRDAGFDAEGPTLLTAVHAEHVRGARLGSVEVYATAGVSNPAALPMDPSQSSGGSQLEDGYGRVGTVNLVVGTRRSLGDAALANLLTVASEAKAATLLSKTGVPGTTTDAVVVACDTEGEPAEFTGSATRVGSATRACVRDAVQASLRARYPDGDVPVDDAEYGVSTDQRAEVFRA
ncbi:MAG: adenosylcobinamide amidohydrolase [Halobacteriota archaeon]